MKTALFFVVGAALLSLLGGTGCTGYATTGYVVYEPLPPTPPPPPVVTFRSSYVVETSPQVVYAPPPVVVPPPLVPVVQYRAYAPPPVITTGYGVGYSYHYRTGGYGPHVHRTYTTYATTPRYPVHVHTHHHHHRR